MMTKNAVHVKQVIYCKKEIVLKVAQKDIFKLKKNVKNATNYANPVLKILTNVIVV
jgi:hypothetical protein